jgi:hypothetical protein
LQKVQQTCCKGITAAVTALAVGSWRSPKNNRYGVEIILKYNDRRQLGDRTGIKDANTPQGGISCCSYSHPPLPAADNHHQNDKENQ